KVPAHRVALGVAGGRTPVPAVLVGPVATAPVQGAKVALGGKGVVVLSNGEAATGRHAIDLAVVVKGSAVFCPGGGDVHALQGGVLLQGDGAAQAFVALGIH